MGVPSFYRWLVKRYPKVAVKVLEEKEESIDTSSPNPNGMEFDNLYLDMNCIIHPCFHPDDDPTPPTTYDEVFDRIYEYIDRLFSIVRPRQVLYMAIDGVAPRAKMNQQRSRRFRTAKDNEISEAEEERLRKQFELEGKQVLPKVECEISDSNIITPGTGFMHTLAEKLKMYIHSRIKDDAGWKSIKVILSDANVPGEGEHKIMSFIRQQRSLPDYNPNTRHCLYGLDADLIMLALATHEVHFSILREDVVTLEQQPFTESVPRGWFNDSNTVDKNSYRIKFKKPYEFLHVWILREYLELDMNIPDPPENFNFDRERIIDDFIFICFFAGNDFLPHMPTLEIHEGAIDLLMSVYKSQFKSLGGYLVDIQRVGEQVVDSKAGYVKLKRLDKFILAIGAYEERIFKKRSELRERRLKRLLCDNSQEEEEKEGVNSEPSTINNSCARLSSSEKLAADRHEDTLKNTKELKERLKDSLRKKSDLFKNGALGLDKVKLGNAGWKERYYKQKFSADSPGDIESTRKEIVQKYTEGLLWVLLYYFSGVPSWTWYYPFHYGPFASDLKGLTSVRVKFLKGSPFKPLDQLLSVLPPRSVHALPKAYRALMTDQNSRIIDFYPTDFEVDTDGKRFWWQGICKLPFIDENRLVAETRKLEKDLMEDEQVRNAEKLDQLFVGRSSTFGLQIMLPNTKLKFARQNEIMKIDFSLSGEFCGTIYHGDETFCKIDSTSPQHVEDVKKDDALKKDDVLCMLFELLDGSPHIPRPPEGVLFPVKTITESDIEETVLWHDYQGPRPVVRPQIQERFRDSSEKSSSTSSPEVYKSAGTGWSAGRGKGNAGIISLALNSPSDAERVIVGMKDCKLSESGQIFRSYGNVQSVNKSARPSRNGFINNQNYESSHFLQSNASPSARPRQNQWGPRSNIVSSGQHGTQFAANFSTQAVSRGHHCPQSWQPVVRPSGEHWQTQMGSTSYTSSTWQHNSQSASNSWNQAQGRGHWQQNLQSSARPFGQPRQMQWGSSTGNPDATVQHSTHFSTNFSAQANWRGHRPQSLHYTPTPRPSAHPWQQHSAQFAVSSSTQANCRGHFSQNLQSNPRPTGQPQRQEGSTSRTESTSQPSDMSWTKVQGRRRTVPATAVPRWNSKDSTPTPDTESRSLR